MIAVDTRVLLRYLLEDDEEQAARAAKVFAAGETILVTDVVLAETVWTLSGRKYRLPKAQLVAVLERLFSEPSIRFEDDQVVWRALHAYRSDGATEATASPKRVGFADALIVFKALRTAASDGELLDGVYTFDAAMQRLPHAAAPQERSSWSPVAKGDELNEPR
ncbi:MAG: type II toxin-antitoxin system VapC family toxin [Acidobacteriota bacterium]|nr:type II toxin-antitoxin system VapC family toxin [Acidobacteriota bacterium]